jgi:hypothetical protein
MQLDHFSCQLCTRSAGSVNTFYGTYDDLHEHFREAHFVCDEAECVGARFVVFANDVELRAHMARYHPTSSRSAVVLNLPFKIRGSAEGSKRLLRPFASCVRFAACSVTSRRGVACRARPHIWRRSRPRRQRVAEARW